MKKNTGLFFSTLIVCFFISNDLRAQSDEVPITAASQKAKNFFLQGREYLENVEFNTAILLFNKAIELDPKFAMAYLYRAQSGGGYDIFRKNLEKAVKLSDKVTQGERLQILLTEAFANSDKVQAKALVDQLLQEFPLDKRVQTEAGNYYSSTGDDKEALRYYLRAVEIDSSYAPAYNMLGYCNLNLNDNINAEKAFKKYIQLIPDKANPYDSYAEFLLNNSKYDESIAQYHTALEKDPEFVFSIRGLGNNYIFKSDFEAARKHYQSYFDKANEPDQKYNALYLKATTYVYEGNTESALNVIIEWRRLAETHENTLNIIQSTVIQGYLLAENNDPSEALARFSKLPDLAKNIRLADTDKEILKANMIIWQMYFLIMNGEFDQAYIESEKYIAYLESNKYPRLNTFYHATMALLELKKGNYDKAIQLFTESNTTDAYDLYYWAQACQKKGDKEKARQLLEKVTRLNDNNMALALVRKRALDEMKQL
ncbi:MAG: tetratricopeptide repeat protein [Bacteroidales bacterium]|nr:tetratricopeptide repeat protein [Bacteroidales bacterium]